MGLHRQFMREERGVVAAEFALVIGFVIIIVFGVVNAGMLFFSFSNLHMAVEDTSRWASIRRTIDGTLPGSAAVQTQGDYFYSGVTATPTFTATTATCGVQVTATTTFTILLGIGSTPMAMTASHCAPLG